MPIPKPLLLVGVSAATGLFTFLTLQTTTESIPNTSHETLMTETTIPHHITTYEDYNQFKLFFHQTFGGTQTYLNNKQEAVYQLTHTDNQEHSNTTRLTYKGKVVHPTLTSGSHSFEAHYQITGESIIESFHQEKPLLPTHSSHTLFSIIPNKIILKSPLKLENKWEEYFIYNGEKHQATSTISNLWLDESDRRCYQIQTSVPTIQPSENESYSEIRVYTEGLGLTSFKNNFIEYQLKGL